jgi:CRP-like cAMP-binding protein
VSGAASADGRDTPVALAHAPLLDGIEMAEIQRLEHFMARFELHPGEHLFSQGDESSSLYVIESGHIDLEVQTTAGRSRTIASLGPGESLGENSLLIGGRRTASAVARDRTCGWILYHAGFDMLRMDGAAGAVELMARLCESAVSRLRRRYETVAAELPPNGGGAADVATRQQPAAAAAELATPEYLLGLLCFREFFDDRQVQEVIGGSTPLEFARGAVLIGPGEAPEDLLLVVRGAVDVSVRRGEAAQRVRLAGPGRFVGHAGVIERAPSPVVAHTHGRLVLIRIPGERVRGMLRDPSAVARRFSSAFSQDVARSMREAERPIARTSSRAGA